MDVDETPVPCTTFTSFTQQFQVFQNPTADRSNSHPPSHRWRDGHILNPAPPAQSVTQATCGDWELLMFGIRTGGQIVI